MKYFARITPASIAMLVRRPRLSKGGACPFAASSSTALAIALLAALSGCGAPPGLSIRPSIHQYEAGNYNAAAHECWEVGPDAVYLNEKAHVRYLAYCGLAYYRIGRRADARPLLLRADVEYVQGRSNWLKPGIVDELYKALDDLEGQRHPRPRFRR